MLQPARKPNSVSFLREFKDAIFILENEDLRKELLNELALIIKKSKKIQMLKMDF